MRDVNFSLQIYHLTHHYGIFGYELNDKKQNVNSNPQFIKFFKNLYSVLILNSNIKAVALCR